MKTVKLKIIKKNRKYFACKIKDGYKCKLKITEKSESLELGMHSLLVEDVSVRTKYGTDVIYEMNSEASPDAITTLKAPYNTILVARCKELGGRWDADNKVWVFSDTVQDEVDELDAKYNSELITIEIQAVFDLSAYQGPITAGGFTLVRAFGRDSGAVLGDGVALIEGSISSGGSAKNWVTKATYGSVFRLKIPKDCVIDVQMNVDFTVKTLT